MKCLLLASLSALAANSFAVEYKLTLLNPLPTEKYANPFGIATSGLATGYSAFGPGGLPTAVTWDATGTPTSLGYLPGGNYSRGNAINGTGQVAGYAASSDGRRAFLYTPGTGMQNLGVLPGKSVSMANAINEAGVVAGTVGASPTGNAGYQAFRWSESEGMVGLVAPSPTSLTEARGINDAGQIVGYAFSGAGTIGCFWDSNGTLSTIGGSGGYTNAADVNDLGQVTGTSSADGLSNFRAYVWSKSAGLNDIGLLAGYNAAFANAINDAGAVVGSAGNSPNFQQRAFLWTATGGMVDLNTLVPDRKGLTLVSATGIDEHGRIVGYGGLLGFGTAQAYMLTPVPEPNSIAAIAAGLFVLSRRKRRNAG